MDIFDALLQARDAYQSVRDLKGKVTGISIAPVIQVFDDDTVTVALPESGGRSESPKLYRGLPTRSLTYPAVEKGDTVLYGFIEGNPNKGVYWAILHNAVNPPTNLANYEYSLGDARIVMSPDSISHSLEQGQAGILINADGVRVSKDGTTGASVTVTDGQVVIQTGGTIFTFSQGGLTISGFGGGGGTFQLSGMSSASINGKQIGTIGATDTRGDSLVSRGW